MKISIITAVRNRAGTIAEAVRSLQAQSHADHEHIVMDAMSSDGTLEVLASLSDPRMQVVSERDGGIYDALNKGMSRSTGEVIGILHSDDVFASTYVLAAVVAAFDRDGVDAVYGDLQYVSAHDPARVIRHWTSGAYHLDRLRRGRMPPQPALFIRREVYERHGGYDTSYKIAADYDAILRWFGQGGIRAAYVPQVLVKMRAGTHVSDLVEAIVRLMDKLPEPVETEQGKPAALGTSPVAPHRLVNIASGTQGGLMHYIECLEKAMRVEADIKFTGMAAGDVRNTWGDVSMLKALTGYEPKVDVETGMAAFACWYRSYYGRAAGAVRVR